MPRTSTQLRTLFLVALLFSAPSAAQKKDKKAENARAADLAETIWRDPGDPASLNLFYGAGGKEHAPDPNAKYTFLKEDLEGGSPKFDVEDEQGVRWRVKLGQEPQSETAATRLLFAAGYFVDEDYYIPEIKAAGLPKLHRGREFVSPDGTVRRVRLERHLKEVKKLGKWDWFDNPFLGSRELNGLRVMMALLNNWDLKMENNSIYEVEGERRYLVSDVGATFGKTGNNFGRSKSVLADFVQSKFIEATTPDSVDFVMHDRPIFADWVRRSHYRMRTEMEKITKGIPRGDARWLGSRLAQLSEEQIRDCFRAAGYTPAEVEGYTQVVRRRIAELASL